LEVEAMSQATSPSTNKPYGVAGVTAAWGMPRSTFYAIKTRQARPDAPPVKRGPKTNYADSELTDRIRQEIAASPFHGEGHRKIWARLRYQGIRTSKPRVLRLMREAQLLAPSRRPATPSREHNGQIITSRPNQIWGTDGTMTVTLQEGNVTVFAAIDHCSADCVGMHAVKQATRFEALEPLRQGVREHFGGFRAKAAAGLVLRHDHGSQYMSNDFQRELRFLGIQSSPSFIRQPEGNGCIERFFRTLKEQLLWVRHFDSLLQLQQALLEFKETYNRRWLIQRHGYKSPWQARQDLLAEKIAA
jgi:putative transposase